MGYMEIGMGIEIQRAHMPEAIVRLPTTAMPDANVRQKQGIGASPSTFQ